MGAEEEASMRRLILMRHGQAERQAPGQEDIERALDAEGRAESRRMGQALAEAGLAPDLALISTARRTEETWRAVGEAFGPGVDVEPRRALYAATAVQIANAVQDASSRSEVVMVVGHNPGIHQYAVHLARKGRAGPEARTLMERFPTGSAAVFGVDAAGGPVFERLLLAKALRNEV